MIVFTKVVKMASRKAWLMRPSGLIKIGRKHACFYRRGQ